MRGSGGGRGGVGDRHGRGDAIGMVLVYYTAAWIRGFLDSGQYLYFYGLAIIFIASILVSSAQLHHAAICHQILPLIRYRNRHLTIRSSHPR